MSYLHKDNLQLIYVDNFKYLNFTFRFHQKEEDKDILCQFRNLYTKSN